MATEPDSECRHHRRTGSKGAGDRRTGSRRTGSAPFPARPALEARVRAGEPLLQRLPAHGLRLEGGLARRPADTQPRRARARARRAGRAARGEPPRAVGPRARGGAEPPPDRGDAARAGEAPLGEGGELRHRGARLPSLACATALRPAWHADGLVARSYLLRLSVSHGARPAAATPTLLSDVNGVVHGAA